ncbi:hypothetical protein G4G27_09775 [Sphingomonas sp. So64.6b]|uniref:hypothetical protein n=1 Tax=Sphingomonas sp. So64.6b TaxID=2997354 RepID=UPI0016039742|nr:hypothetical protein [Sphingomonas sp. So64.6b]QNA84241.1 hypothetical protein G4G27_09775 [Sphingomonas sp. So64.6b]
MKKIWLLALAGLSTGCTPPATNDKSVSVRQQKIASLNAISQKCGLPQSALTLEREDDIHFQPPPTARYESFDCALTELRKSKFPKLGFVGNEQYVVEGNSQ